LLSGLRCGCLSCGVRILLRKNRRGGKEQSDRERGQRHDERDNAPEHRARRARHARAGDLIIVVVLVQLRTLPARYGH
jgi:hypothetical protein